MIAPEKQLFLDQSQTVVLIKWHFYHVNRQYKDFRSSTAVNDKSISNFGCSINSPYTVNGIHLPKLTFWQVRMGLLWVIE